MRSCAYTYFFNLVKELKKKIPQGRLIGLDGGKKYCGVAVSNTALNDWAPWGSLFLKHHKPVDLSVRSYGREDRFQAKPFSYTVDELVQLKDDFDAIGFVAGVPIATEAQKEAEDYEDTVGIVVSLMDAFRKSGKFKGFPLLLVDENRTSIRANNYAKQTGFQLSAHAGYTFTRRRMEASMFYKTLLDAMEAGGTLDIYFDRFSYPNEGDYDKGVDYTDEDFIIPKAINPMEMALRNMRLDEKMFKRTKEDILRNKPLKLY